VHTMGNESQCKRRGKNLFGLNTYDQRDSSREQQVG
jgi:hypothetical protein